jgi:Restriction endonuclease PvuII
VYCGIELQSIYIVPPAVLEEYFGAWETKWSQTKKDINNPKIPLKFVVGCGTLLYGQPPPPKAVVGPPKKKAKEQPEF